ncbi:MAG: hypothetical protein MZV64_70770 [Ignavibacteriales bacterium]|nr:hypothetical protein [Ignavibacteriales bacterium]
MFGFQSAASTGAARATTAVATTISAHNRRPVMMSPPCIRFTASPSIARRPGQAGQTAAGQPRGSHQRTQNSCASVHSIPRSAISAG